MTNNTILISGENSATPFSNMFVSTRPDASADGIRGTDIDKYKKLLKEVKNQRAFWSPRQTLEVPLGLPTISANRWPDIGKILSSVTRDGFDPGIWQDPVVVAVPGELIRDKMSDDIFREKWDIRESGFFKISKGQGHAIKEWYLQICDGRHRQTLEAARQGAPAFYKFDELTNLFWKCQVTFWEGPADADRALKDAAKLYLDITKKKIRKPSAADCLGAEYLRGDDETQKNIARLECIGVWVHGGKRAYGDLDGVLTKYGVITQRGLKDSRLNDTLLKEAVRLIRLNRDDYDPQDRKKGNHIPVNASLIVGIAHALNVCPQIQKNGTQKQFEKWFADISTAQGNNQLAVDWNEKGGNQDNKNAESIALGMLRIFHNKLKSLAEKGQDGKSLYKGIDLKDIESKLFPPKEETK